MLKKKLEEIRDDIVDKFVSDFQRYRAVMDDDELLDVLADSTDYLLDLLERKIMRLGIDAETYIAYFKENVSKEAFNTFLSAEALYGPAHDNILGAYNGTEKVSKDMSEILEKCLSPI